MNDGSEKTILEEGDVKITDRKAIFGTKTYALSDVISARMSKDRSAAGCATAIFICSGLLLGLFSLVSPVYDSEICKTAFIFLGAAILVALLVPPSYILQIRSMSGQADILRSMDGDYLKRIVDTINDAIVRRNTGKH